MPLPLRAVGKQGLQLPAIAYGAMGQSWAYSTAFPADSAFSSSGSLFSAALEQGCTAIVTARIYSTPGLPHNEELVGAALRTHGRSAFTVITKIGVNLAKQPPHVQSPEELREELEQSLAALGTDFVDVLVLNRPDPQRSIAETMKVFKQFVAEGKAKYVGLSEATPEEIRAAHAATPLSLIEGEYSLFTRDIEAVLPTMRELGIGLLAYSPLSRGLLTKAAPSPTVRDWRNMVPRFQGEHRAANEAAADAVAAIAAKRGCTPSQLALAWLLAQGPDIVPAPGTTSLARLTENLAAVETVLSPAEADELRALVPEASGERYAGMHGTFNSKMPGAASH